jgi:protein ImuB
MERRIVSLWLPRLATDRRVRLVPGEAGRPLAAVRAEGGRHLLAAVDVTAGRAGVRPGMTLADARAMAPELAVFDADLAGDGRALDRLAGWCTRFTPWTAADGADGLVLDITGCAHLLGGEPGLLADLCDRLAGAGFESRAAVADTPAAAWGVARFAARPGAPLVVPPAGQRMVLDPLPVAALRLAAPVVDGLAAVGLRRIGDLHAIPRANLTTRFGPGPGRRLDQALGRQDEPVSPRQPTVPHTARLAFAEPVATATDIAAALRHLLDRLSAGLLRTGEGARRLTLEVHRVDGRLDEAPQVLGIGTSRPVRDPGALMRLFAQRLEQVDPGLGIETMVLLATVVEPLAAVQTAFDGRPGNSGGPGDSGGSGDLGDLVDRLGNRLGEGNVIRLAVRRSWWPERCVAAAPPLDPPDPGALSWPADRPRPVRLLAPPEPVEVVAPVPDDPPMMFRWKGALHRVRHAEGPERLCPEWWRPGGAAREPRDYYRVEDLDGRRFWLFREGLYRPGVAARWFLHGVFG